MTISQPPGLSRRLAHAIGLLFAVALAAVLTGCSSPGATGSATTGPSSSAPRSSETTTVSSDPVAVEPTSTLVTPRPGQLGVHAIAATSLTAAVDGRRVVVTVHFWSGIEPCSILDSIQVERGAGTFSITLREGHGPEKAICDMIAVARRAIVDLGDLEPGSYTIGDATGGAPTIPVTIT